MKKNSKKEDLFFEFRRIRDFLYKVSREEVKREDTSRRFRGEFFVDVDDNIENMTFHNTGIDSEKAFQPLSVKRKEFLLDAFFETIVVNVEEDDFLKKFLKEKKIYERKNELEKFPEEVSRVEVVKKVVESLLDDVQNYFGGFFKDENEFKLFDDKVEGKITEIKKRDGSNIVKLGELEGFGVCRHRAIMFKLLCDIVGIKCRIIRGFFNNPKVGRMRHMWNEVVIKDHSFFVFTADAMLSSRVIEDSTPYIPLNHPYIKYIQQQPYIDRIKKEYPLKNRNRIASGSTGDVFELNEMEILDWNTRKVKVVDLAVKEVNLFNISQDLGNDIHNSDNNWSDMRVGRRVLKEIEFMKLFNHPNVVDIIGSFILKNKYDETVIHILMKKYDRSGYSFLREMVQIEKNSEPWPSLESDQRRRIVESLIFLILLIRGISYIHDQDFIHFDIKPQNILLNWDKKNHRIRSLCVSDLGSMKKEGLKNIISTVPSTTVRYEPPEFREAKRQGTLMKYKFSQKFDIYSIGVIMSKEFRSTSQNRPHHLFEDYPRFGKLAAKCISNDPKMRPEAENVCLVLRKILEKVQFQIGDQLGITTADDFDFDRYDDSMKVLLMVKSTKTVHQKIERGRDKAVRNLKIEIDNCLNTFFQELNKKGIKFELESPSRVDDNDQKEEEEEELEGGGEEEKKKEEKKIQEEEEEEKGEKKEEKVQSFPFTYYHEEKRVVVNREAINILTNLVQRSDIAEVRFEKTVKIGVVGDRFESEKLIQFIVGNKKDKHQQQPKPKKDNKPNDNEYSLWKNVEFVYFPRKKWEDELKKCDSVLYVVDSLKYYKSGLSSLGTLISKYNHKVIIVVTSFDVIIEELVRRGKYSKLETVKIMYLLQLHWNYGCPVVCCQVNEEVSENGPNFFHVHLLSYVLKLFGNNDQFLSEANEKLFRKIRGAILEYCDNVPFLPWRVYHRNVKQKSLLKKCLVGIGGVIGSFALWGTSKVLKEKEVLDSGLTSLMEKTTMVSGIGSAVASAGFLLYSDSNRYLSGYDRFYPDPARFHQLPLESKMVMSIFGDFQSRSLNVSEFQWKEITEYDDSMRKVGSMDSPFDGTYVDEFFVRVEEKMYLVVGVFCWGRLIKIFNFLQLFVIPNSPPQQD